MKTVTREYKVYSLDELTHEAQSKAYNEWRETQEYFWGAENMHALDEFCDLFHVKVTDWSVDEYTHYHHFHTTLADEDDQLKGIRLVAYIWNHFGCYIFQPKTYHVKGNWDKKRKSHIIEEGEGCCVLTGYVMDEEILGPVYDFLRRPDKDTTFVGLMDKCLEAFFEAYRRDLEYCYSEEHFQEECADLGSLFLEDGTLFEREPEPEDVKPIAA